MPVRAVRVPPSGHMAALSSPPSPGVISSTSFRKFLQAVNADGKALIVTPEVNMTVYKSARNLPGVLTTPAAQLSVYDILNAQYLVVDQAALAKIEEVYA